MTADDALDPVLAGLPPEVAQHVRALALTPAGEEPRCGGPAGCVLPAAHSRGCPHTEETEAAPPLLSVERRTAELRALLREAVAALDAELAELAELDTEGGETA